MARQRTVGGGQRSATRADRKNEADAALAAFLGRGGEVKLGPSVVPTILACSSCGYSGVAGVTEGKIARCPKCREPCGGQMSTPVQPAARVSDYTSDEKRNASESE